MKRIFKISFICWLMSQVAFSDSSGHLFRATVQGTTLTVNSTSSNWIYPHAGISSAQSGVSFSSCNYGSNGQCIFSVSDTQSASIPINGATTATSLAMKLCQDGYSDTYNCESLTVQLARAYVTNYNAGTISLCSVNSTTGAFSNTCTTAASGFSLPRRVVLNATGTLAYVVVEGGSPGSIQLCQVSATGLLTLCAPTGTFEAPGLSAPSDITFSSTGSRAYVTDVTNQLIFVCNAVNTSTGALGSCTKTVENATTVTGIVLNRAGTIAYYSQAAPSNTVSYCAVNPTTGVLTPCSTTGFGFISPEAVTLNPSGTYAYISNDGNGNISVCSVVAGSGALSGCTTTSNLFSGRGGVVFNTTGTTAYFPSFTTDFVYQCDANVSTGLLSNCKNSGGATFVNPSGIALLGD